MKNLAKIHIWILWTFAWAYWIVWVDIMWFKPKFHNLFKFEVKPYLKTFFHWHKESKTTVRLVNKLFVILNNTLTIRSVNNIRTKHISILHRANWTNYIYWTPVFIFTEFYVHQCPNCPSRLKIENHPGCLIQMLLMELSIVVSVYHQSHATPIYNTQKNSLLYGDGVSFEFYIQKWNERKKRICVENQSLQNTYIKAIHIKPQQDISRDLNR